MTQTTRVLFFIFLSASWFACQDTSLQQPDIVSTLTTEEARNIAKETRENTKAEVYEGFELSLWASDSLAKDPIALDMDDWGRAYITRTNRQKHSEFDIRGHRDWMIESVSFRNVEERRDFLHKTFAPEKSKENEWLPDLNNDSIHDWRDLAVEKEEVYRIEDLTGDGIADYSQLYIQDFHDEVTDVAGAVMAFENAVYLGVAPDLWKIEDVTGDGKADRKTSLSHGYAVHIGFGGHGMSGLTVGPDGRIYWSIGDIGFSVVDKDGKKWDFPNQGGIFRSEPDGSGFEVFARGLRNTHEFVFDEYGNLFSVDNDGDHPGEKERLVYVVNGSDAGWRTNWQYGKYIDPNNNLYKVWMDEEYFKPRFEGQAAHIVPPIMNYHSGPAGMVYHPGNALNDQWRNHFFIAEFVGSPSRSHVYAFQVKPKGAGFDFAGEKQILGGVLATGMDFGPDGALYIADWIEGWDTKNYGRIWKLDVTDSSLAEARKATAILLKEDFADIDTDDLADYLRHEDMRIRQKAQFALAERRNSGKKVFLAALTQTEHQLSRIHGIWGIGQMARKRLNQAEVLVEFLNDRDPEIRTQVLKTLGDIRYVEAADTYVSLLSDPESRVRFFAAEALGRIGYSPAISAIISMLEENNDEDLYLRHAGALALARIGEAAPILALDSHPNEAVRLAAVVALRRLRHPGVAQFLDDANEYIVTDAARAINDDLSIEEALPDLARLLNKTSFRNEPLVRRMINANLRVGEAENIAIMTQFAANTEAEEAMRVEALATLGVWPKPSVLDRVDGRLRGEVERDPAMVREAVEPMLGSLLSEQQAAIQIAAAQTAGRLALQGVSDQLIELLAQHPDAEVRQAALAALHDMDYADMDAVLQQALADREAVVRMQAMGIMPELGLEEARVAELLQAVLGRRPAAEQQVAVEAIGQLSATHATPILTSLMDQLAQNNLMPDIQLELMEAIEASENEELNNKLLAYRERIPKENPLAAYQEALYGGDPQEGFTIFIRNASAQCMRCHGLRQYGGDVGPDLTLIGKELNREELLLSLVAPSARIAPGYGEPDMPSSMPPMGQTLEKSQLRDLVAFLAKLDGSELNYRY